MVRPTISRAGVCLAVGIILLAASARAAPADDQQTCAKASGEVAIAACTRAIASGRFKGRELIGIYNNRGFEYRYKGDLDRAIADYSEAIRLDPKYALTYSHRGFAWRKKGDFDRAIADYSEAVRLDPKYARAYDNRGDVHRDKGDLHRAIADYSEAIRLDPKYAVAYHDRCIAWRNKGDLDRAIADYSEAIRLDPKSALAYNNRGLAWRAKGDLDRAIADCDEAIRLDPKSAVGYNYRGLVWRAKGDLDHAMADYNQAIRFDPKYSLAYDNRGDVYRDKGDLDRAIMDYSEAIRLDPKYTTAYNDRGLAWRAKGDLDRAIADSSEAIQLDPKFASAWLNRCFARARISPLQPALADCDELLRLQPENVEALDSRGFTYLRLKRFDEAIADYDAALRLDPKQAGALYGRGMAKRQSNIADGDSDVAAAKTIEPGIEKKFAAFGIVAPRVEAAALSSPAISAARDRRVALVIGNSAYTIFPKLPNPRHDAEDLGAVLKEVGFDVLLGLDLKRTGMEEILIQFARKARISDTALVFYAGHGLQHLGINYLAPVDAAIEDETDLRKLVNLQDVMNDLQGAGQVRILIVDACRDNEVIKQLSARLPATRSAVFSRGLAKIDAADVAFATQPNRVAEDGTGRNSPFTQALLKYLPTPGLELRTLMTRVRTEVVKTTGGAQRPEVWDSLVGEFTFQATP